MRVLLIHNPKAGDGKHSKKQLVAMLTRYGHQPFYQSTKKSGWKKALKKPVDVVIAAGGDGTVRKAACQLMDSGIPLAILPLGTANNLAHSLGFAAPVEEIVRSLGCGKRRSFDVGLARGLARPRIFLEAAGGGLFADYFRAADRLEKRRAIPEEKFTAHLSLLRDLAADYPAHHWKMSIDGENVSGVYILWGAMNIRSAGPALRLAPKADTDDGRLDFVAIREREREAFTNYVQAHLAGERKRLPLMSRKFHELKITSWPRAMHLDGKQWPPGKSNNKTNRRAVEVTVKPGALTIWHVPARHT